MRAFFILVSAALLGLTACTEEPQRLGAAERAGYVTDGWPDQLRRRTLRQNESSRIY